MDARAITVRYGHGPTALLAVDQVSIQVNPGETVGIVGESGSGKSTLARVLAGVQRPISGAVSIESIPVIGVGRSERLARRERWRIQMVFQDPYSSLNPRMRAWEAVAEALHVWRRAPGSTSRSRAFELLESVGITSEQAQRKPSTLSGGQRQRVSIARALAPDPQVLIADEPTSAIDLSAQAQLLNLLRSLQAARGLSIVFVSHNLAAVRYLASRVHVMKDGRVVEDGMTREVLASPRHEYTRKLLAATQL